MEKLVVADSGPLISAARARKLHLVRGTNSSNEKAKASTLTTD